MKKLTKSFNLLIFVSIFAITNISYGNLPDFSKSKNIKQKKLLNRVDIVPTPLILAQAANESAWVFSCI